METGTTDRQKDRYSQEQEHFYLQILLGNIASIYVSSKVIYHPFIKYFISKTL